LQIEIKELLDQPEPEPVAWIIETEIDGKLNTWICTDKKHYMDASDGKESIPLYTAPHKREPLSDEVICEILLKKEWKGFVELIRKIEELHGIGVDND
jgi:hypothetical protein